MLTADAHDCLIDCANPIAWAESSPAPVAWYLCLPGLMGGAKWHDLMSAADLGIGAHGTLTGITQGTTMGWQPVSGGRMGSFGAMKLFGSSSYIDLGSPSKLNLAGPMTVTAWINLSSVAASCYIASSYNSAGTDNNQWAIIFSQPLGAKLRAVWAGAVVLNGNAVLSVNTWYHVAMVRGGGTGSWTVKLFINGGADASGATATNPQTQGPASIGRQGAANASYFPGFIDDVQLYNVALSDAQVQEIYFESRLVYPRRLRRLWAPTLFAAASGAASNSKSFTGSLTCSGALVKQTGKPLTGSLTTAGALSKAAGKPLAGGTTLSSSIVRSCGKALTGTLSPAGGLVKATAKVLTGSLSLAGDLATSLIHVFTKSFDGALILGGSLVNQTGKALGGSVTLGSGTIRKAISKTLAGPLTLGGSLAKGISKALSGLLSLLGIWSGETVAAPSQPGRIIDLFGRDDTTIALTGHDDTTINLLGSDTMSVHQTVNAFVGEDITFNVTVTTTEDITGWTWEFRLLDAYGTQVYSQTTGFSVTDPDAKIAQVTIARANLLLDTGDYIFEVRRTSPGRNACLADGPFRLSV